MTDRTKDPLNDLVRSVVIGVRPLADLVSGQAQVVWPPERWIADLGGGWRAWLFIISALGPGTEPTGAIERDASWRLG